MDTKQVNLPGLVGMRFLAEPGQAFGQNMAGALDVPQGLNQERQGVFIAV